MTSQYLDSRLPPQHPSLYEELLYACAITGSASSVLIRAGCFAEAGVFDETLFTSDIDMWRRLALSHQFLYLEEPLAQIRKHTANMSNSFESILRGNHRLLEKMRAELPLKFRFHLLTLEAVYYARGCRLSLVYKRSLLSLKFIARFLLFSVQHPLAASRAIHWLFKRWQLLRAQRTSACQRLWPCRDPGFEGSHDGK